MSERPGPAAEDPGAVDRISAGRVARPHGLDGSFYVGAAKPRLLALGTNVLVGDRMLAIIRRAGVEARPIVRLEGVEDRSAAEALRGLELKVPSGDAPDLGPQEWWAHELEGCSVVDEGRPVGRVVRMLELPSCEVLEVRREQGGDGLLVPMVRDAIRTVEVGQRRIDVDMGFLGEPWS